MLSRRKYSRRNKSCGFWAQDVFRAVESSCRDFVFFQMIRLTCCTHPTRAGSYFRLHLATGDNPAHPAARFPVLRARWTGPALPEVALVRGDQPEVSQLVRLCRGLHPIQRVRLAPSKNRKRAYYDVTIAAPKTVSLAALLNPNHLIGRWIMEAHIKAVEEVIAAVGTMLQPQSSRTPRVSAWLGATFHHTHSREGDPHLHSHLILPNVMRNTEGQWRAMQVNIAGLNRTYLGLIYGHALTRNLRSLGFRREELLVRRNGMPELRAFLPLVARYSQATRAVLAAAADDEAERRLGGARASAGKHAGNLHPRSKMPVPLNDLALKRRRRLSDQIRRPKPKEADDPVRLSEEASRWHKALTNQEFRSLLSLLDELDPTNPRCRVHVMNKLPPKTAQLVEAAYLAESSRLERNPSEPLLLRAAVAHSAGRHTFEELRAACEACLAKHRIGHAKAMKRIREGFAAEREAEVRRMLQARSDSRAPSSPRSSSQPVFVAPPAAEPPAHPAPAPKGRGGQR